MNPEITIPADMWNEICSHTYTFKSSFDKNKNNIEHNPASCVKIDVNGIILEFYIYLSELQHLIRYGDVELSDQNIRICVCEKVIIFLSEYRSSAIQFSDYHSQRFVQYLLKLHQDFYANCDIFDEEYVCQYGFSEYECSDYSDYESS